MSECKAFNQSLSFVNDKLNLDLDLGLTIFELEKKFYKLEILLFEFEEEGIRIYFGLSPTESFC